MSTSRLLATKSIRGEAHRAPTFAAFGIAVVLLAVALFVQTATQRAARVVIRQEGEAHLQALARTFEGPDHPDAGDLARLLEEERGLRYAAVILPRSGTLVEAGAARGSGWDRGEPLHIGDRARLAIAGPIPAVVEYEPVAANDVYMAGRIALVVILLVDLATIALGVMLSRSLRARAELTRRLEVENTLAVLGEMSAVLAHELKNPLASLKGNAQLLAEVLPEGDAKRTKADRVVREAVRLERLTEDLLELVRTNKVRRRSVDPREPVDAAIAATDEARVERRYEASPATCEIDPDRLRVAIENVIRNALQASSGAVEVEIADSDRDVVISVRDHGPGIPAGEEEAIFQPFRSEKARGTGIGLAIAKRIVELHLGTIEASNHAGGGAVFRMSIPKTAQG